jgi:hypothetical protein
MVTTPTMFKAAMPAGAQIAINDAQSTQSQIRCTRATIVAAIPLPIAECFKRFSAVLAVLDHVRLLFPV